MPSLLIALIYLAFVSMGLPDALLGSAWPAMYPELDTPVSYAGILTVLISSGTVISSLLSNRVISRFGTGQVTTVCTALTAIALFGFSSSSSFWHLCFWALPYGLGAGSIDVALNNYVALYYKSRQMSWLHFSWGIGATAGPYIMGFCLAGGKTWNFGFLLVGVLQVGMVLVLLGTLSLWRRVPAQTPSGETIRRASTRAALRVHGVKSALVAFFCYCALEFTAGLWASSYLVIHRKLDVETAATWASFFYLGITIGRFVLGFIADAVGNRGMVRAGLGCAAVGTALVIMASGNTVVLIGLILIGLGCAPIYPCLLHATPDHFGADHSQALMGVQMACAYTGSMLMPLMLGMVAEVSDIAIYPYFLLVFIVVMAIMTERVNRIVDHTKTAPA